MKFLEYIADLLVSEHNGKLINLLIVVPTQRARVYLLRNLAEKSENPTIAPHIMTMDQWMSKVAALEVASPVRLYAELFQVGKKCLNQRCKNLTDFLSWGPQVVRDFDAIDQQLINPKSILTNTARAKSLEYWEPNRHKGHLEQIFEEFYNSLPALYEEFKNRLQSSNLATRGMVYRKAAELIDTYTSAEEKIYFIGFNALTKSEYKVIKTLVDQNKAELISDFDTYYTTETANHEAGRFYNLLVNKRLLSEKSILTDHLLKTSKKITHHRISGKTHQVDIVAQIVQRLKERKIEDFREVAIVLPDESMLFPLLHHLPSVDSGINVTMNIPLIKAPVFQWLTKFLRATDFAAQNGGKYYFRHLQSILTDGVAQLIFSNTSISQFLEKINQENRIFIEAHALNSVLLPNTKELFKDLIRPSEILSIALEIFEQAFHHLSNLHIFEAEQISLIRKFLQELNETLNAFQTESLCNKEVLYLMEEAAEPYGINLLGEPLEGIQIMGMLETRLLDFQHVILLSANDDIIPGNPSYQSIIPYDIAVAYELPEFRYQQAIKSYHYYRLLQRAEEIHLLSYSPASGSEEGTPSRFIYQIQWELCEKNKNIQFSEENHNQFIRTTPHPGIFIIEKDEFFIKELKQKLFEKGITPSHLANYLERPESFYTSYLLELREYEEIEEDANVKITGNIVHDTLQKLYSPYLNQILTQNVLKNMMGNAEAVLQSCLEEKYGFMDWNKGKNFLASKIILQMIKNQIQLDLETVQNNKNEIVILHLEEQFSCQISIPSINGYVRLYGKIDRIQSENNLIRIIDYKTGSVKQNVQKLNLNNLQNEKKRSKSGKEVQLLSYLIMVLKNEHFRGKSYFSASLNFLRNSKGISVPLSEEKNECFNADMIESCEIYIRSILREMLTIEGEEFRFLKSLS